MSINRLKNKIRSISPEADREVRDDLGFNVGLNLVSARLKAGLSQTQLAKLVGTKQPNIARIENGSTIPTLPLLQNLAHAMGTYLIAPKFGNVARVHDIQNIDIKIVTQNSFVVPATPRGSKVSPYFTRPDFRIKNASETEENSILEQDQILNY